MKKDQIAKSFGIIETTIGDLIEAITDIALEAGKTEEEGYHLASLTLGKILGEQKEDYSDLIH